MGFTRQELMEAERQIDSTLRKLQKVFETLRTKEEPGRYQSQITLTERRIQAFSIARDLIRRELEKEADYHFPVIAAGKTGQPNGRQQNGRAGCGRDRIVGIIQ